MFMHSLGSISIAAEELAIHNIIYILKKLSNERTSKDIAVLTKFLEFSDLMKKFRINNREMTDLHQMFYHSSMYMKHQFIEKDKNIFQYGEKGDRFYIILKGRIQVFKPVAELERLTALDYFIYLKSLYEKKEKPLLKMALDANKSTFPINNKDIPELDKVIFRLRYRKALISRASAEEIKNIFSEHKNDTEFLSIKELNLNKLHELKERELNLFYQRELSFLTSELNSGNYDSYKYAMDDSSKKILTIFTMNPFMIIETGQYFGDLALDDDRDRSATMRALEDSHLGYLESNIYKEHIASQKRRFVLKEIMFLLDNFFLGHIKKENFEINHFPSFIYEEYARGETLIKENEQIKNVYFIKEGEVEISCNKNILEIHKILKILTSIKVDYQYSNKDIYQFQNQPKNFIEDLKRQKKYKLFIYGSNEVLGAEQFYFNLNSIYQAKVISDKLKVYKIQVRDLQFILEEKNCLADLDRISKNKIVMLANRFIEIKNVSLKFLDAKIAGRQSGINNIELLEDEIEHKQKKNSINKSSRKILTINYSLERIENELTLIKPNSTRNEKFINKASKTNSKTLKSIQNSPNNNNNLDLPLIELKTMNNGNFSSTSKKELKLENQQIQNLKSELKLFSRFSISDASNTSNFELNSFKYNKKVSLESGADYYMKTYQTNQNSNERSSLNDQSKEYFLTEVSSQNEINANSNKSFKGDRTIKTNKKFKNNTSKFISDNELLQIKENFISENFSNSNKINEISKFRINTNESDLNDSISIHENNSKIAKRKITIEDSCSIKSILLKFNYNDMCNNTSSNTFLRKLNANYFSKN